MRLPLYQLDSFASRVFAGNPAAVCPLQEWLPVQAMQAIAAENNLSETAFFVGADGQYAIRWFTPETESDLCGHATLASAHVILTNIDPTQKRLRFTTQVAGDLAVEREGDLLVLDFPAWPPKPVATPAGLVDGLGAAPEDVQVATRDYLCIYKDAATVRNLKPDLAALARMDRPVLVTAPGPDTDGGACDFVSRFFAPCHGIPEDPVTGSAHCTLTPYWAQRLGKTKLRARQVSRRGGELSVELRGDRVRIGGKVAPYLEGTIEV
jgi:PhzF family phenazine biosynthesis protein